MNKLIIGLVMLISSIANAGNEFAYMPNKAGGSIIFTFSKCVYVDSNKEVPNNFYVYSTDSSGNKITDGCYEYKYPFYFVVWNGGGKLSVNVSKLTIVN